jgi:hypothetical protein
MVIKDECGGTYDVDGYEIVSHLLKYQSSLLKHIKVLQSTFNAKPQSFTSVIHNNWI